MIVMPRTRAATPREDKVEELLDAAEKLFEQTGFSGTSTSKLARAAGISEKTLFWYFPSKDHLLVSVVERRASRLVNGLRRRGWPSGDFADDLFRILRALRTLRHLLPVMHQRAEASEHVAAARERSRAANHHLIAASLRSLGLPEAQLEDAIVIVVSFGDGVLLRNVRDAQLQRLCRSLVDRLGGGTKRSPSSRRTRSRSA